jgi:glycosyltransferase involved in cell wall biosynthesis
MLGLNMDDPGLYPKISIITPSYNQGKYIEETILSVLSQNYPNLEYIVIDGESTDNTVPILEKYSKFIKWVSEPDNGQTHAINKGLRMASGEILAYLNSDDLYEPDTLFTVANFFKQREDIAMVYGDVLHINERSEITDFYRPGIINLRKYLMWDFYLPQPSVFFRRSVIGKIGYFDERLHLAMDYDYWLKIILGLKTHYIPQVFSRVRKYPEAKSRALDYLYHDERLLILDSAFKNHFIEQYRKNAYSYTYFSAALLYMKRYHFLKSIKNFSIALSMDKRYIIHPYLYWGLFEMITGERFSRKIKVCLKKDPYKESMNFIK